MLNVAGAPVSPSKAEDDDKRGALPSPSSSSVATGDDDGNDGNDSPSRRPPRSPFALPLLRRRPSSREISVTCRSRRPRAVVVLLGPIDATSDRMSSYESLYHDRDCSTIVATAPTRALLSNDAETLSAVTVTAAREAARLVRMGEMSEMGWGRIPVVLHSFGNGGAYLLDELERKIAEMYGSSSVGDGEEGREEGDRDRAAAGEGRRMASGRSARSLDVEIASDSDDGASVSESVARNGREPTQRRTFPRAAPSPPPPPPPPPLPPETPPRTTRRRRRSGRPLVSSPGRARTPEGKRAVPQAGAPPSSPPPPPPPLPAPGTPPATPHRQRRRSGKPILSPGRQVSPARAPRLPGTPPLSPPPSQKPKAATPSSSPLVRRTDVERTALNLPRPTAPLYNPDDAAYNRDLYLVSDRLRKGFVLFDSGPCYPKFRTGWAACPGPLAKASFVAGHLLGRRPYSGVVVVPDLDGNPNGASSPGQECIDIEDDGGVVADRFWSRMRDSDLSPRTAFLYGDSDPACDVDELEGLIEHRRRRRRRRVRSEGVEENDERDRPEATAVATVEDDVRAIKFVGSAVHAGHLWHDRVKYERALDGILDDVAPKRERGDDDGGVG